jgi:hypothetical protein
MYVRGNLVFLEFLQGTVCYVINQLNIKTVLEPLR